MLLRPSTTCDEATRYLAVLTDQGLTAVQNAVPHLLHGGEEDASVRSEKIQTLRHTVYQYDQWTLTATTELSEVFADRSIPARMRGERYSNIVYGDFTARRQAQLLNLELQELRTYFLELANKLRQLQEEHKHHRGRTVVLDTNDLLHFSRYDKIPWTNLYGKGAVVVIPHVVVDEIDKKSYATSDTIRKRARGVFALLEQTLAEQYDGHAVAGGARVEVLLDEPGHVRLPNNDDEIVARACQLKQAIAPTPVTVLTGDNGMRARALAWGLEAGKLPEKYRIERIGAQEKTEYLAAITASAEPGGVS
ncbi:PIN domain-containing protein [Streptomyces sp. NBC_01261]|uniref:PIN domain-containing protein n=1 Tax=Streptomyces sp. NBC_01261 TaxID=2903802 RepID=UPI002E349F61|nr:PIN domain-containing protein [Streptomyces sp. NBC_01261]